MSGLALSFHALSGALTRKGRGNAALPGGGTGTGPLTTSTALTTSSTLTTKG